MNIVASPGSENPQTSPLSLFRFITWYGGIIGSIEIAPISNYPAGKDWTENSITPKNGELSYLTY